MLWVTRCKSLHCRVAYGVRPSARNETLSKSIRLVSIPVHQLDFNFCRSSGPGGQNVNKVNTKAELRFNVHEADWCVDLVVMCVVANVQYSMLHSFQAPRRCERKTSAS